MSPPVASSVGNASYAFYDENYKPMWNRGISRKLGESDFVQQTLPTIRPSWSVYKVCPIFLFMGAFFIGMGIYIKIFSDRIQEITVPYTYCQSEEFPGKTCSEVIKPPELKNGPRYTDAINIANCTCHVPFELLEPLNGTVYIYYALADYYQNHKRYYLSRDENQLKGKIFEDDNITAKDPAGECKPFDGIWKKDKVLVLKKWRNYEKITYPCGLMANSMFTDEISLMHYPDKNMSVPISIPLRNTGIAWESDREDKYKLPPHFHNAKHPKWSQFMKPLRWKKSIWELDPTNVSNNGVVNEDFLVWMRAGAFPWFRKMYRIVDPRPGNPPYDIGLPKGKYALSIMYNYDVESYRGEKSIILSTTHIVAGKNIFLSIAYLGTGTLLVFLSILLFVVHKLFTPSLKEMEDSLMKNK